MKWNSKPYSRIQSCRECTDRYLGCHSKCEKYIREKAENDAINEEIRKKKKVEQAFIEYHESVTKRWT